MKQLLSNDVLKWRSAGAAVWQAALVSLALASFNFMCHPIILVSPTRLIAAIFSVSTWIDLAGVLFALAPATAMHAGALLAEECSTTLHAGMQLLPTPLASLVRRVASRSQTLPDVAGLAGYWAAHAFSATLLLMRSLGSRASLYQTGAFSVALAATYLAHVLYFSRDVLHLPTIQRHRYFRIKQQLPAVVAHAAAVAAVGCFLGLITSLLSGGGVPTPIALVSLFEGCLLCVLCWMMGTVAIEVVFTERLRPHDYGSRDPAAALEQCLEGKRGAIMRLLALHDLSLLAIDAGKESWRRTDVFADETGARWVPLAQHCVAAIQDLTASMAPAKSGPAPKGGKETAGRQGSKWNAIPAAVIKGAPTAQRQNLDALGAVRCRFQSAKLAGRALAGFAVASLREDRFGVLQLAEPNLGDVVLGILSALLAAKHLARQGVGSSAGAALGPWRATGDVAFGGGESDAAVHAVIDELGTDVRSVAEAFGAVLEEAVGKSTTTPSFATKAEAMAALHARLRPGKLS